MAGDWDGNGVDGIGIYNAGAWSLKNAAAAGVPDLSPPVVGDWNGDGIDTIGVKSRTGTTWLSNSNTVPVVSITFDFGQAQHRPALLVVLADRPTRHRLGGESGSR